MTSPEDEPYILTKEEEDELVKNKIEQNKQSFIWKMANLFYHELEIMERIKQINWEEEIDKETLFRNANANKHQDLWHKEQREKEKQAEKNRIEEILKTWDAKYFFRWMKSVSKNRFGKDLIVNEYTKGLITTLCYFLSGDERFEKELGYSFRKGLLIRGISGVGKTHLVRCVEDNKRNPILVLSMIDITEKIKSEGEYVIEPREKSIIYLDDVGTEEPTVKHYGTSISFFKNFIESTYLRYEGKTFNRLMISTNNSFDEMEEKYGFRVRSRIKEMFNIVDVDGVDMRK